MNPREDDPDFAQRRPTFGDIRDDYDDEFGRNRTPRELARRRLLIPGIAHGVIGVLGVLGMLALGVGVILNFMVPWRHISEEMAVIYALLILAGLALFALVIVGGVDMLRLRRRWLSLYAAYVVTGLTLVPFYSIFFSPFGIWALVLLYRPDVQEQFGRRPAPRDKDHGEL